MLNTNQNQTLTLHGSLVTRLTVFYCQKKKLENKNNTHMEYKDWLNGSTWAQGCFCPQ